MSYKANVKLNTEPQLRWETEEDYFERGSGSKSRLLTHTDYTYSNQINGKDQNEEENFGSLLRSRSFLSDEMRTSKLSNKCSQHPEENLDFYSFTDNKPLCSECLVSGSFLGHEVVNIKKASERVKIRFKEIIEGLERRIEDFISWENLADSKTQELNRIMSNLETQIKTSLEDIRKKVASKEKEILDGIEQIKIEKQWEIEIADEAIKKCKDETISFKENIENMLHNLNDFKLCSYYTEKKGLITNFLKDEEKSGLQVSVAALKSVISSQQFDCDRFNETLKILDERVSLLAGVEEKKSKSGALCKAKAIETEIPDNYRISMIVTPTSLEENRFKFELPQEAKENIKSYYLSPPLLKPKRDISSPVISKKVERESSPHVFDSNFFEKYSDKIQEIRKQGNNTPTESIQFNLGGTTRSRQSLISLERSSNETSRRGTITANPITNYQNLVMNRKKDWTKNQDQVRTVKKEKHLALDPNTYSTLSIRDIIKSSSSFISSNPAVLRTSDSNSPKNRSNFKAFISNTLRSQRSPVKLSSSPSLLSKLEGKKK